MRPLDVSEEPGLAASAPPLGDGGANLGAKAGRAFDRVVLRFDHRDFTIRDVLDTAWFRGQLQPAWRQFLDSLATQKRADDRDLEADDAALQTMSEEFRYDRHLLTTEETERWLAARDLTEDDFGDFFLRRFWAASVEVSLESAAPAANSTSNLETQVSRPRTQDSPAYFEATADLLELLRVELLLSGDFDSLVQALSWRLAALSEGGGETQDPKLKTKGSTPEPRTSSLDTRPERARFLQRNGLDEVTLPNALRQLGRDAAWLEECLRLEAAYHQVCVRWLTDDQRARVLAARRLALTRVQLEVIVLPSIEAAQEAVLCLREGEVSVAELARQCRVTCDLADCFIEEAPPDLQQALLSASPGEILGPLAREEAFAVCRLAAKSSPDVTQPEVRERIDQRLLEGHFAEMTAKRIRFILDTGSAAPGGDSTR